jgi:hypothetical protein
MAFQLQLSQHGKVCCANCTAMLSNEFEVTFWTIPNASSAPLAPLCSICSIKFRANPEHIKQWVLRFFSIHGYLECCNLYKNPKCQGVNPGMKGYMDWSKQPLLTCKVPNAIFPQCSSCRSFDEKPSVKRKRQHIGKYVPDSNFSYSSMLTQ